jgi:uncharacterized protein YkwD
MRSQYFAPTGKSAQGPFLNTLQRYGVQRVGYPVSDQRQEQGMTVQYFERVRMEYHPEKAGTQYEVLMTRLGVEFTRGVNFGRVAPFGSTNAKAYVPETGHSLAEPFLSYWRHNGGIELFGYPISEVYVQDGVPVQWFERARFEYHRTARGGQVLLSNLGKVAYERAAPQTNNVVAAPAGQVQLSGMESFVLKAINDQRAAAGLQPVQLNGAVTELSRARSGDMAGRNYFSHTTPEGGQFLQMLVDRGVGYKYAGEVLARNNLPDAEAAQVAMDSYLNSPPHRAIILDGRYNTVGIGYAKSGEDNMHYFTVIFVEQ